MSSSDAFQHLSDSYIQRRYDELKAKGWSDDDISMELFSEDCNLDDEDEEE